MQVGFSFFFGVGSVVGGWLGGKLTDLVGFYKVMFFSLLATGFGFIWLQYISSFWGLCFAILLIMSIADTFRPAIYVSIKAYSNSKNQTKSIALIRLAINAGMALGPTLAGLIIVTKGYNLLFWIDGITCIVAILLFRLLVKPKEHIKKQDVITGNSNHESVYRDYTYWIFIAICFFMGMAFFQLVVVMPLYYNDLFGLDEFKISLILFINVAVIIAFEMPFINYLEKKAIPVTKHILVASLLMGLSFFVLFKIYWIGILIISIIIITFGEMLGFPYTNKFAFSRAKEGKEGSYMALYAIAFSVAHIFSPKIGLSIVDTFGYNVNWIVTGSYGIVAALLSYWLIKRIKMNK